MAQAKEVMLPSGAILKITVAPFAQAKELYQALLKELRGVEITSDQQFGELFKNLFASGFSSKEVERCLWKCMERCTYAKDGSGDLRIKEDTFEPEDRRQDYVPVCMSVAKENIDPFVRGLWHEYSRLLDAATTAFQPSRPTTTPS